ncbi:hypothetical protein [Ornithinimicrobium cerasi]|uniref:hypothetical protein n=1 Tax=Ornithinimicrobium cerasi TaxID=2248773 RepID=UPI000F00E734|nr:hypothetical protein [Ornithinimicrobium cerasi]
MHTHPRSLALTITLTAALLLTGCGEQSPDVGAPAPATPTGTTDPAPTSEPPTSTPTERQAPTTPAEPEETDDGSLAIADEPAWTAAGHLVGAYGDVAVVHDGEPGSSEGLLTALGADGSVAWERELSAPEELAGATDLTVVVLPGHHTLRLAWTGTLDGGLTLAAGAVVDPTTGEDVAIGALEVPAGYVVSEPVSGDQLWLAHPTDVASVLTIAEDGTMMVDDGADGYDLPVDSLAVMHDLLVDTVDDVVRVLTPDGPVGESVDCYSGGGERPGVDPVPPRSPNRDLIWLGMAVVDLGAAEVTCVEPQPDAPDGFTALADDGTLAGPVVGDEVPTADCAWCGLGGVALLRDGELTVGGPVEARPEGFLGDLLLMSTEAGVAAYPLG